MLYNDYNWTWNHWKLTGFIANSKFNLGSSKVCCDSKSFPAIVRQLIGLPLSPTSPEVFTAEKKKKWTTTCYTKYHVVHTRPTLKKLYTWKTLSFIWVEQLRIRLHAYHELYNDVLQWTLALCSNFKKNESCVRWSHDTQYFRKDGPRTRWEIVLRKVKERSVPAQLLMPEDTSPFLLLKMYQVILVWGSTWVSDACLHAGSYATNTVKVTSSQITRELFGRAEERKTNVSFPFTSTAGLQLSPVVSTAGCLEWGRGCQVMVNV